MRKVCCMDLLIGLFRKRQVVVLIGMCWLLPFGALADLWTTGYYPGWEQYSMPASSIDFTALTHVIHFSLIPNADGSLNSSDNGITSANANDLISRAHAAGTKVIICVGGAGSESDFQAATRALPFCRLSLKISPISWLSTITMGWTLIGNRSPPPTSCNSRISSTACGPRSTDLPSTNC